MYHTEASAGGDGSPPHLRGKRAVATCPVMVTRITPAPAGKTAHLPRIRRSYSDHPRTCGENARLHAVRRVRLGSPPHLRGKPLLQATLQQPARITPAPAGKTLILCRSLGLFADHPRTCGENEVAKPGITAAYGSPPHLRGKQRSRGPTSPLPRITPAPAGKTPSPQDIQCRTPDHPRTCGENLAFSSRSVCAFGSPPHLRGKPARRPHWSPQMRITPAPAGKTDADTTRSVIHADHPRTCGENLAVGSIRWFWGGSPPHLRGKRSSGGADRRAARITPAPAGKTPSSDSDSSSGTDHPRTCGENRILETMMSSSAGSPPHLRGKLRVPSHCF